MEVGNCAINGSNITKAAYQSTTNGFTGPIRFNLDGDRARDSRRSLFIHVAITIDVYQFTAQGEAYQVGYWNSTGTFTPNHPSTLRTARSQIKYDEFVCVYLGLTSVTDVFDTLVWDELILMFACVGCAICLVFLVIVLWNRKHPAIVLAPLVYLLCVILGVTLLFISLIIIYLPSTAFNCFLKLLLLVLGVSIING